MKHSLPPSVIYLSGFTPRFSSYTVLPACLTEFPSTLWMLHTPSEHCWSLHKFPLPEMPSSSPLFPQWTINPLNEGRCSWLPTKWLAIHSFLLSQHLVRLSISTYLTMYNYSFTHLSTPPSRQSASRGHHFMLFIFEASAQSMGLDPRMLNKWLVNEWMNVKVILEYKIQVLDPSPFSSTALFCFWRRCSLPIQENSTLINKSVPFYRNSLRSLVSLKRIRDNEMRWMSANVVPTYWSLPSHWLWWNDELFKTCFSSVT